MRGDGNGIIASPAMNAGAETLAMRGDGDSSASSPCLRPAMTHDEEGKGF